MVTWRVHVDQGMDGRLHVRITAPPARHELSQYAIMEALSEAAAIIEDLQRIPDEGGGDA